MQYSSEENQNITLEVSEKGMKSNSAVMGDAETVASSERVVNTQGAQSANRTVAELINSDAVFDHKYASAKQSRTEASMKDIVSLQPGQSDSTEFLIGKSSEREQKWKESGTSDQEDCNGFGNGSVVSREVRAVIQKKKSIFDDTSFHKDEISGASENGMSEVENLKCGHCEQTFKDEVCVAIHLKKHEGEELRTEQDTAVTAKICVAKKIYVDTSKGLHGRLDSHENIQQKSNTTAEIEIPKSVKRSNFHAMEASKPSAVTSNAVVLGPMASVGKRNAKKKINDDFIIPQNRQRSKQVSASEMKGQKKGHNKFLNSEREVTSKNRKMETIVIHKNSEVTKNPEVNSMKSGNTGTHGCKRKSGLETRDTKANNCEGRLLRCPQCNCCFLRNKSYSEHLKHHGDAVPHLHSQLKKDIFDNESIKSRAGIDSECKVAVSSTAKDESEHKVNCAVSENKNGNIRFSHATKKMTVSKSADDKEVKIYKCYPCKRSFKDRRLLFIHKKRHPNAYKPFKCEVCDQSFAVKKWLDNHAQRHTVDRKFPCDICGKKYLTKGDAVMHKRRHTLERKFHCDICQKNFVYRSELNSHLKKHQGLKLPKNIPCDVCGKKFATRRDLQRHTTVHTGEQPFECPLCGKKFSQEVNMQIHIKIHTNIRPHKCDNCEKSFITKGKLLRHRAVHTKPNASQHKPFKCLLCPRQYTAENSLVRHLKTHRDSPSTVTNVTEVLTKAMEKSKTGKRVTAGAVLANLIDQAIFDAKMISRKGKGKTTVHSRSLTEIIDQAIHNSKATSLGTQTPIIAGAKPRSEVTRTGDSLGENSVVIDCSKNNESSTSVQTIIVKPKSAVVNHGPTDHRKFCQNPTLLHQFKLNVDNPTVCCIPMQEIQIPHVSGRDEVQINNMRLADSSLRQVLVHPTLQISGNRTNESLPCQPNIGRQYNLTVPDNLKSSSAEINDYTSVPKLIHIPELPSVSPENRSHLSTNFGPQNVRPHPLISANFNSNNHFVILPTNTEPTPNLSVQPLSNDAQYFILQTDAEGQTVILQAPAVTMSQEDQSTSRQFSTLQGDSYLANDNLLSVSHHVETGAENSHLSFITEKLHQPMLPPQPTVIIQGSSKQEVDNLIFTNSGHVLAEEEEAEVYSYPMSIDENVDSSTQFTVEEVHHLNTTHNMFTSRQGIIIDRDEIDTPEEFIEIPTEFVEDGLEAKPINSASAALYAVGAPGSLESAAVLGITPRLSESEAVPAFDGESSHILCNVPSAVIPGAQFLEHEILEALEKRICPSQPPNHDTAHEDIVLADSHEPLNV